MLLVVMLLATAVVPTYAALPEDVSSHHTYHSKATPSATFFKISTEEKVP